MCVVSKLVYVHIVRPVSSRPGERGGGKNAREHCRYDHSGDVCVCVRAQRRHVAEALSGDVRVATAAGVVHRRGGQITTPRSSSLKRPLEHAGCVCD